MSTETHSRTPEEIYAEIETMSAQRFDPDSALAEKTAWVEARVEQLTREAELWRELHAALPYPTPSWQRMAALRASDAAFEQMLNMRDRLERFRQRLAEEARLETPQDGHVYECCGKVGRISRHETWCTTMKEDD